MTVTIGCLVIPLDLALKALEIADGCGWFGGFQHSEELVFVALEAELDGQTRVPSKAFRRLQYPRLSPKIEYKVDLVRWIAVQEGFQRDLLFSAIESFADVEKRVLGKMPLDNLSAGRTLLCCIERDNTGPNVSFIYARRGAADESDLIVRLDAELVSDEPEPLARLDGLLPLESLRTKRVVVVGAGSGGGFVALELAAAGVGQLHAFDRDRLRADNLFRHVCGRSDLGREKVRGIADLIRDHELPAEVFPYFLDVMTSTDVLREVISQADVVVGATDTVDSRRLINYLCVRAAKPLVMACTFDNARIGEVIRVLPGKTACYECIRSWLRENGGLILGPTETLDNANPYSSQSMAKQPEVSRGTRTDVFMVAAIQAKVALMTLLGVGSTDSGILPRNYLTWGAVRNVEFRDPFVFPHPFSTNFVGVARNLNCPICGQPRAEILGKNIDHEYEEIIASLGHSEEK